MKTVVSKYTALTLISFFATFANALTISLDANHLKERIYLPLSEEHSNWFKANLPYLYKDFDGNLTIEDVSSQKLVEALISEGITGKRAYDLSPFEQRRLEPQISAIQKQADEYLTQSYQRYKNIRLEVSNMCSDLPCSDAADTFKIENYDFDKGVYKLYFFGTPVNGVIYTKAGPRYMPKGFLYIPMSETEAERLYKEGENGLRIKQSYVLSTDKDDSMIKSPSPTGKGYKIEGVELDKLENIKVEFFRKDDTNQLLFRAENVPFVVNN